MTNISINSAIITVLTNIPSELCNIIKNQYFPDNKLIDAHTRKWNKNTEKFDHILNYNDRKTDIKWIPEDQWIAGMITYYIDHINKDHFRYDISGISDNSYQYSVYREGSHYDWHADEDRDLFYLTRKRPEEKIRKLSFSLQLSEETDYEGGELCFRQDKDSEEVLQTKKQGSLIVFDSRLQHCVKPVTKGVRHSLVGWYSGPLWR